MRQNITGFENNKVLLLHFTDMITIDDYIFYTPNVSYLHICRVCGLVKYPLY